MLLSPAESKSKKSLDNKSIPLFMVAFPSTKRFSAILTLSLDEIVPLTVNEPEKSCVSSNVSPN